MLDSIIVCACSVTEAGIWSFPPPRSRGGAHAVAVARPVHGAARGTGRWGRRPTRGQRRMGARCRGFDQPWEHGARVAGSRLCAASFRNQRLL